MFDQTISIPLQPPDSGWVGGCADVCASVRRGGGGGSGAGAQWGGGRARGELGTPPPSWPPPAAAIWGGGGAAVAPAATRDPLLPTVLPVGDGGLWGWEGCGATTRPLWCSWWSQ